MLIRQISVSPDAYRKPQCKFGQHIACSTNYTKTTHAARHARLCHTHTLKAHHCELILLALYTIIPDSSTSADICAPQIHRQNNIHAIIIQKDIHILF
uniref:Uncharacterized protein n=1 Tax=Rhipicephalus appendiculatus TaxID=34631 RepID=A0A131YDD4_RHIAP